MWSSWRERALGVDVLGLPFGASCFLPCTIDDLRCAAFRRLHDTPALSGAKGGKVLVHYYSEKRLMRALHNPKSHLICIDNLHEFIIRKLVQICLNSLLRRLA